MNQKITIITTGGTIEKTYSELDGSLSNRESIINDNILKKLRLPYTQIEIFSILAKDSLDMTDDDREFIAASIKHHLGRGNPIVVLHGTDTMQKSAEFCEKTIKDPKVPVIFTGAMRPLGFVDSDAHQNVTEALFAAKLASPGFYISFHNELFKVPGVRKNLQLRTFERF